MDVVKTLEENSFILTEAAVIEALSRTAGVELHPRLEHALLLYDEPGRKALTNLYNSFIFVAKKSDVPVLITTPTWRANRERVAEENGCPEVNRDAVAFLRELRMSWGEWGDNIGIGGFLGCRNDCYRPEEGLSIIEAEAFHSWQVGQFEGTGVDFLLAATLPAVDEAAGMALAMAKTGIPFILSFVINREGLILDGSTIEQAVGTIDALSGKRPLGYMINCAYPSFLDGESLSKEVMSRIIGYQANASSLDHAELDGMESSHSEDIHHWSMGMLDLHRKYDISILGGCCGTRVEHLEYIINNL